jgi:hypothetical protein
MTSLALWALSHWPWFVEAVYARGISFQISRALSTVAGVVPTSVAALVLVGVALYVIVPLLVTLVALRRRQRRWGEALGAGALRTLAAALVAFTVFYLVWGLNYARAPLQARLGWPLMARPASEAEPPMDDQIAALAAELIEATNESYRAATGGDDLGRPTTLPTSSEAFDAGLDDAFVRVQALLGLEPQFAARRGPAKPFTGSVLLSYLGLTGFYFPFTGEPNYNGDAPASGVPHYMAHEKSHQRGIALEDEAHFIAYLACVMSDDPYAQYSGYLFGQSELLGELWWRSPARVGELRKLRSAGVNRDLQFRRDYWARYEGLPERIGSAVNDRYLRAQGIAEGVGSYAASRHLLILFARQHGGSLRLPGKAGRQ